MLLFSVHHTIIPKPSQWDVNLPPHETSAEFARGKFQADFAVAKKIGYWQLFDPGPGNGQLGEDVAFSPVELSLCFE